MFDLILAILMKNPVKFLKIRGQPLGYRSGFGLTTHRE
jgi:hypothetical protein